MARQATVGLDEEYLAGIAQALSAGGKPPRVVLRESSAGLPAGTAGTVVRLADRSSTDEFVVVRVNNDELPFTPAELAPPPPKQPRRLKGVAGPGKDDRTDQAKAAGQPAASADRTGSANGLKAVGSERRASAEQAGPAGQPKAGGAASTTPADPPRRAAASKSTGSGAPTQAVAPARPARSGSGRGAARRGVTKLSVTVSYDDRGWTVEASRGARSLIKATPIAPKAALRLTELLDDDQVTEAVADIIETERQEAARRADELRAQLAEVEAVLAGYGD